MGLLINIDNGGTLTDFCAIDGQKVYRTKTVTTPYDLSQCFFDGLRKTSRAIYGEENLQRLLLATEHIRYSTTQGTNALVERKGPRLGLLLDGIAVDALCRETGARELFEGMVGSRHAWLDTSVEDPALEREATRVMNQLAAAGASRIVVGIGGPHGESRERRLKSILLRKFPPHLLGALPVLYSHELVRDEDDTRRLWTALFNAFLHPPMERFLYNAEHRLREHRIRNPLLFFRNDGGASRIARTAAVKTYSSGPRGGAEGMKALAAHHGLDRVIGVDIGGTTTDISLVENGEISMQQQGAIEGVTTSLPLCRVQSVGVGGSSIIGVTDGAIEVGPESVGGAPGPACFGLGGREATITDAFLVMGLLDPGSYFGGELPIDVDLARAAVEANVAGPLRKSIEDAALTMEKAWVGKVAASVRETVKVTPGDTLAAFGGAGPFVICTVAEALRIERVIIPGLAAVFSAFGIGFSDITHEYETALLDTSEKSLASAKSQLLERAARGMFAEGFRLDECRIETRVLNGGAHARLALKATRPIARAAFTSKLEDKPNAAKPSGARKVLSGGEWRDLPLYRVEEQGAGTVGQGPAILEEAFFTCRVEAGWTFHCDPSGDIVLTRSRRASS
jgi:N-methylhydantoinase A/oxoprolinase/acetone carboxylase beta subunit